MKVRAIILGFIPLYVVTAAHALPLPISSVPDVRSALHLVADAQGEIRGAGKVNAVDAAKRKLNLTHKPIAALGWPTMTMDFAVAPSVDLKGLEKGAQVDFTMAKNAAGTFEIRSVTPAGGK